MQEIPLSVARILHYGATAHRNTEVATYFGAEPDISTFGEIGTRCAALANLLEQEFGIGVGERVGTMLSNCTEHLEALLGISSMGAVFAPINRLLMADQIQHVINHAQPRVLLIDPAYTELLVPILVHCPTVEALIVVGPKARKIRAVEDKVTVEFAKAAKTVAEARTADPAADIPDALPEPKVIGYEDSLDGRRAVYDWPELPETSPAAICYSTGTEGAPKGVVYSHRALWLHSMSLRAADSFGVRGGKKFLCGVPIYHVLSWGVPLAAFMAGAPLVFTGRTASPDHLAHVIADAMPRQAHGSPAVWTELMVYYGKHEPRKMSLQQIYSGGSPVSPALIHAWEERFGVDVLHAWGMTETGPVATVSHPPAGIAGEARARYRESQGRFHAGMEYRLVDDHDRILDINDRNVGELQVRGNTVTGSYYHSPAQDFDAQHEGEASVFRGHAVDDASSRFTEDGWLRTGDIGTVTQDGYLIIHDRKSDLIRSGGEWIYSAALENYLMEPVEVIEAATIGIPDEKWGQRPLAIVVLEEGVERSEETARMLAKVLSQKVPRWMLPEYWTFVDRIDKTSVDKYDKKDLRIHYRKGDFDIIHL